MRAANEVQPGETELVEKISSNKAAIPDRFVLPPEDRPVTAKVLLRQPALHERAIPVIDMRGLQLESERQSTLLAMHRACIEWGFFQAVNHGVSWDTMQKMKEDVQRFLAQPAEERALGGRILKGAEGQGFGTGFMDVANGVHDWRDFLLLRTSPEVTSDYSGWPSTPATFRNVIRRYTQETKALSHRLLACLSEALQLEAPSDLYMALLGGQHELQQILIVNHYPPCPQPELAIGNGKHTDLGGITILWQVDENVHALQVFHDEEWVPVCPLSGAVIVNVGDMLQVACNGIYKSVVHRAVVNADRHRTSIASFYNPQPDAMVRPIPLLVTPDRPSRHPPVHFLQHALKVGITT